MKDPQIEEILLEADIMFCETCMRHNKKWLTTTLHTLMRERIILKKP